jgi:hypothetical protein
MNGAKNSDECEKAGNNKHGLKNPLVIEGLIFLIGIILIAIYKIFW